MSSQSSKLAKTIISYLRGAHALSELPGVVEALLHSPEYLSSQHRAVITSALALDAKELKAIESHIKKVVGDSYALETRLDPGLLAGFTLQIDDTLTDASALGKIETIHSTLNAKD